MPELATSSIVTILSVLVAAVLVAEGLQWRPGIWIAKPLAACAYVWLALAAGATGSAYGLAILAALILSWWGDVLLVPRERPRVFRAGILAFLAGHIAYAVAFVVRGVDFAALAVALAVMSAPALVVYRWLAGRVPGSLKGAVTSYIIVISVMFALACATHVRDEAWTIVTGAGLFWLSDLCVARDRFVERGFANRLVGLPLYFAAQVHLALSVSA